MDCHLTSDHCNELPLPPKLSNTIKSNTPKPHRSKSIQISRRDANLLDQIPPPPTSKQQSINIDQQDQDDFDFHCNNICSTQGDCEQSNRFSNQDQISNNSTPKFELTSNNYLPHSSVDRGFVGNTSEKSSTSNIEDEANNYNNLSIENRQSQLQNEAKAIQKSHDTKTLYTTISHAMLNGSTTDPIKEDSCLQRFPKSTSDYLRKTDEVTCKVRRRVRPHNTRRDLIDLDSNYNHDTSEILTMFDPLTSALGKNVQGSIKASPNRGLIPPPPTSIVVKVQPPQDNDAPAKSKRADEVYISLTSPSLNNEIYHRLKNADKRSSMRSITSTMSLSSTSNESEKLHATELNTSKSSSTFAKLRIIRRDQKSQRDLNIFTNKLKQLRSKFCFKDSDTNSGLVLSPTLFSLRDQSLSVKLVIQSPLALNPITFTCNIRTTIEHLISHAVCSLFENLKSDDSMGNYLLKVTGRDEYFESHRCLADYSLVNHCCKFGMDVSLTLVVKDQARKPYLRTEEDDSSIESILSPDDLLSNSAILEFSDLNYDALSIMIETLEKEAVNLYHNATHRATSLQPQSLLQATKAICSHLMNSEPTSITEAKENLAELCRTYKSEANYMKSSNNIVNAELENEHVSLTESNQSYSIDEKKPDDLYGTNINSTMIEVIEHALSRLLNHLAEQIDIISHNLCVDFKLQETLSFDFSLNSHPEENGLQFHCDDDSGTNADFASPCSDSPTKKLANNDFVVHINSIPDEISFYVHLLTQPCPDWAGQYQDFHLKCEIWYGERKIAGPICTNVVRQEISFFPRLSFDETLVFTNFPYKNLPRESRLILTLLGTKFLPLANSQSGNPNNEISPYDNMDENMLSGSPTSICSTSPMYSTSPGSTSILKTHEAIHHNLVYGVFYLFDSELYLCQGTKMIGLQLFSNEPGEMVLQPDYPRRSGPCIQIEFRKFEKLVKFPEISKENRANIQVRNSSKPKLQLEDLDIATQQDLLKIIEEKESYECLLDEERALVWSNREYLRDLTNALPKVILSVPDWSHSQLGVIYEMIDNWTIPSPVDAMQLLLPSFPDAYTRERAVNWISNLPDDELCDYLPQLVQAIRAEAYLGCPLVLMLFGKALSNVRISNLLYWQFKLNTKDLAYRQRSETLLNALHWICGSSLRSINLKQEELLTKLTQVSNRIKSTRESQRLFTLHKELETIQDYLIENKPNLPIAPSLEVCDIDIKSCSYFTSNTLPLRLAFRTCEESCNRAIKFYTYETIFKIGDDLRQDMLAIQIIRIMEKLWLREGLDLRMVTFDCLATDDRQGLVELVKNADTLRKIQANSHFLKGPFEKKPIVEWLKIRNTSELEYQQAVDNFTHSCAGYSVATYVLGICDRHNDNIMVTHSGHLFHIDFGKFLGDAQMMGSIKRDRTPFVLTADMAYVINGGDRPSKKFQTFIELCTMGFNIIRRNRNLFLNLFSLMTESNIPGLSKDAVRYIDKMLMPGLTEAEAMAKFTRMIDDCLNSRSTQVNFFIHNLAQLRFSADNQDRTLLSFIPKTFTKETDGKIKSLQIVKCYKEKTSSEKQYYYIIQVLREQQVEPEFIVRTYREFSELQMKLSWQFPLNTFHALQKSSIFFMDFKRSNVREVAEKRMVDLNIFLEKLLQLPEVISHCDLVYTFFHPILRDQGISGSGEESGTFGSREYSESTRNALYHQSNGQIKLSLVYKNASLIIMVMHAKNLPSIKGTAGPNSYAKTYLLPDPAKRSKQKTRVIRQSCHPTFMELIVYKRPLEHLKNMTLQVSVWDCDYVQVKAYLGAALIPLKDVDLTHDTVAWYPLRL